MLLNCFLKKQPNRFKRLGSITKLQKALGHSSINVSLTYLRGLEVPELAEGDMPLRCNKKTLRLGGGFIILVNLVFRIRKDRSKTVQATF